MRPSPDFLRRNRRSRLPGVVSFGLTAAIVAGAAFLSLREPSPDKAARIEGVAQVIDGDTLRVRDARIRLFGIDAPELDQSCDVETGGAISCGRLAARFMERLVAAGPIICLVRDTDRYGRPVAKCSPGAIYNANRDLGAAIVRAGHAIAYRKYSADYVPEEEFARDAKLGMWATFFIAPEDWRRR